MVSHPGKTKKNEQNLIFSPSFSLYVVDLALFSFLLHFFSHRKTITNASFLLSPPFSCMHPKNKNSSELIWPGVFFLPSPSNGYMPRIHSFVLPSRCAGKIGDQHFSLLPTIGIPRSHLTFSCPQKYNLS